MPLSSVLAWIALAKDVSRNALDVWLSRILNPNMLSRILEAFRRLKVICSKFRSPFGLKRRGIDLIGTSRSANGWLDSKLRPNVQRWVLWHCTTFEAQELLASGVLHLCISVPGQLVLDSCDPESGAHTHRECRNTRLCD